MVLECTVVVVNVECTVVVLDMVVVVVCGVVDDVVNVIGVPPACTLVCASLSLEVMLITYL